MSSIRRGGHGSAISVRKCICFMLWLTPVLIYSETADAQPPTPIQEGPLRAFTTHKVIAVERPHSEARHIIPQEAIIKQVSTPHLANRDEGGVTSLQGGPTWLQEKPVADALKHGQPLRTLPDGRLMPGVVGSGAKEPSATGAFLVPLPERLADKDKGKATHVLYAIGITPDGELFAHNYRLVRFDWRGRMHILAEVTIPGPHRSLLVGHMPSDAMKSDAVRKALDTKQAIRIQPDGKALSPRSVEWVEPGAVGMFLVPVEGVRGATHVRYKVEEMPDGTGLVGKDHELVVLTSSGEIKSAVNKKSFGYWFANWTQKYGQ